MDINQHIKSVLRETIRILFPLNSIPKHMIKPHIWRDRRYVGEAEGKVVAWRGWSANLSELDFRYRPIYIDVVENKLPLQERQNLFGSFFTGDIAEFSSYVVIYALDFPLDTLQIILDQGFTPRMMSRSLHACIIASPSIFLSLSPSHWAAISTRLVILQRAISIHRKPFDENEIPLQHLLFNSGYLHSYIVNNGLELYKMSQPRKAGEFGHDFHAIVNNPTMFRPPFNLGIEVYVGSLGYHATTIPDYATSFLLRGMIVVAKDDPFPIIKAGEHKFSARLVKATTLAEVGQEDVIAIHHLPLGNVIADLALIRDELETLVPVVPILH